MADRREDAAQDALFREVDEDLRHEQMASLWKKYGGVVIAAALAIVLSVAGYQGWQAWQTNVREDEAARYQAAVTLLEQGDTQAALSRLEDLADDASTGYGAVAALRGAALAAEQGDAAAAVEAYRGIAGNSAVDPAFRDLATVLAVLHAMEGGVENPDALIAELQPLMDEEDAFRFSAMELTALLSLRQGDEDRARDLYARIVDSAAAPQALRGRAGAMLTSLGGAPTTGDDAGTEG
ncbi:hypothetical protein C882_2648 [Caenispirillum salinarum AK4]|uniref:Ancillary SecYEG translocon subunit n=1 Tax=Caenispirillum salinarum AK4 TaxID=1238182 RepID=K9H670_9PROT|nr:tetratricopeptide repeat protein [Caenispirillum salinarum]EKV32569.1 hypothetical protein C882_2648 [Caenispirillum salinarum AK4]